MAQTIARVVVVGDVHGFWDSELDGKALRLLKPDIVLFVGDFGDEDVQIVQDISRLNMPKAVILGNHDCCYTAQKKRNTNNKSKKWLRVEQQLQALGDSHVGYSRKDFPDLKLSVIGVRPFAKGGDKIYNGDFISEFYGVDSMDQSAKKIAELAFSAPRDHSLIFLGHNGPTGLGGQPSDICGNDFEENPKPRDHGDPDLAGALNMIREHDGGLSSRMALVVFGHMHKQLLGVHRGQQRNMCAFDGKSQVNPGTVYVNGAVVPRCEDTRRHFTVVEMAAGKGRVLSVKETWVNVPKGGAGQAQIASEKVLFATLHANPKHKAKHS